MRSFFRHGVIAFALLGGVALGSATESPNTGSVGPDVNTGAASSGPIGATGHTMPAKFSAANDALDKMPIMGPLLPLTDEQKGMVRDSLAATSAPEEGTAAVGPATELPADVAIHDLPSNVTEQAPALKGYKFAKLVDKIVIVSPPNRVVVGEIAR
jgi:Protein of unknown function (DUF1236)